MTETNYVYIINITFYKYRRASSVKIPSASEKGRLIKRLRIYLSESNVDILNARIIT